MAHLVEHLAFRTGGDLSDGEYDVRIESLGGESNGWTRHDWVTLSLEIPAEGLAEALSLEVGRMGALTRGLEPEILQAELDVISHEHQQRLQSVTYADMQMIRREIYPQGHPYRQPLIAHSEHQGWSVEEVQAFEAMWLQPAQSMLLIVGPVSFSDVQNALGERAEVGRLCLVGGRVRFSALAS